jgi:hypothetical protein
MLSSIHPLGERARDNTWGVTAGTFTAGAIAGGVVLGALSGGTGWIAHTLVPWSTQTALIVAVAVVGVVVVGDMVGWAAALPWPRRQVNENWLATYRGWVYGSGFGFQLGAGLFTYVSTLGVYATIIIAFLSASPVYGALIGAAFGLFRGLPVLTTARINDAQSLRNYHMGMARWSESARIAALTSQTAVLAGAFALVVTL